MTSVKTQSSHPRQKYPSILWKGFRHAHRIQSSYSAGTYCRELVQLPSSMLFFTSFLNFGEPLRGLRTILNRGPGPQAVANSTGSIKVASSPSAFELLTRFDTGQRCR